MMKTFYTFDNLDVKFLVKTLLNYIEPVLLLIILKNSARTYI
jgi:hypothetical protein